MRNFPSLSGWPPREPASPESHPSHDEHSSAAAHHPAQSSPPSETPAPSSDPTRFHSRVHPFQRSVILSDARMRESKDLRLHLLLLVRFNHPQIVISTGGGALCRRSGETRFSTPISPSPHRRRCSCCCLFKPQDLTHHWNYRASQRYSPTQRSITAVPMRARIAHPAYFFMPTTLSVRAKTGTPSKFMSSPQNHKNLSNPNHSKEIINLEKWHFSFPNSLQ